MINQSTLRNWRVDALATIKAIANANIQTFCYCDETETLYHYNPTSGATADDQRILTTGAGGATRWIGVSGKYVESTLGGTGITLGFGAAMGGGDVGKYYQPHGDANGGKFSVLDEESQIACPFTGIIEALSWISEQAPTNAVLKLWQQGLVTKSMTISGASGVSSGLDVSVTAADLLALEFDAKGSGLDMKKTALELFVRSL